MKNTCSFTLARRGAKTSSIFGSAISWKYKLNLIFLCFLLTPHFWLLADETQNVFANTKLLLKLCLKFTTYGILDATEDMSTRNFIDKLSKNE